ncbi:glycine--tRNA ligase subunit beta, partial [Clostridium cochlearium]
KNMFIDMGIRYDVVEAILGTDIDDVFDLKLRADKLNLWLDKEGLSEVLSAFNRVKTLAEKAETDEVKRELLVEEEEIKLYETFNSVEEKVKDSLNCKEYDKALDYMVSLKGPIDQFFDNVMVMVEDEELKNNRLGLVKQISNTMLLICDLSKIMNK